MNNMEEIIKDIENIRQRKGETHGYFTINGAPKDDEMVVDILDVCKALSYYEVDDDDLYYDEDEEIYFEYDDKSEVDEAEQCIDYLIDNGVIEDWSDAKSDNTFNWSAPVSNDINFTIFKCEYDSSIYVLFRVHLCGDVRVNYTDNCLLKFDNDYDWYETIADEVNRTECFEINDNNYYAEINFFNDGFEVTNEDGEYLFEVYGYTRDEVKEEIIEQLKEM